MSNSIVHKDDTKLSKFDQILARLEHYLTLGSGLAILLLIFLAVAQIFGRKLFNVPVPGFVDWVEQFMAVFAFLGVSYCQRYGGHIRMDIVISRFKGRALWAVEIIGTIAVMLVIFALFYGSLYHFLRAYNLGDSSIDIALPIWPAKFLVPMMFFFLLLRLLIQLWGFVRAFKNNLAVPVAVPLIMSVEEMALQEAADALGEEYESEKTI